MVAIIKELITLWAILLIANSLIAQDPPIIFGELSNNEINMTFYDKDSTAPALVLCDYGNAINTDNNYFSFTYTFTRNLRIKIFNKEGYKYSGLSFIMNKHANTPEIKAITYNFEGEAKIESKLDKKQVFREHYDKNYDVVKFEMPAIKEGCIIDIEYSYLAGFSHIRPWYFQSTIPTVHSEYRVSIPCYFEFKPLAKGFYPMSNLSSHTRTESNFKYISKDVPAFHHEEYLTSIENYLSSIQFELAAVKFPNQLDQIFTKTWPDIGKLLVNNDDFDISGKVGRIIKNELNYLSILDTTPESKITMVYEYIRDKMNWNNQNSIFSEDPKKAWDERKGSSGDINLFLLGALSQLGFDARPVILSTRSNGFVHPAQIILEQYNYVIASVKIADKTIFLDATDKYTPFGILPERCINGQGRMIDKAGGYWLDLNPNTNKKLFYMVKMEIKEDFSITGNINEKYEGYAAVEKRNSLSFYTNDSDYLKEYQKSFQKLTFETDSITDKQNSAKPLTINYRFESDDYIDKAGDLLFINPIIINRLEINPFKLEKREYPVDYSFPQSTTYMTTITIPEGYKIENLPENKKILLPEKNASFLYSIQLTGNGITVISKFDINKVTFLPEEYLDLKEFYNQVIDAMSKQIILKKI